MAELDVTNIPPPRVPLIDQRTGLISREWYRFFVSIFNLTGVGGNPVSLEDLQKDASNFLTSQFAEIEKQIEGLQLAPPLINLAEFETFKFLPFNIVLTGSPFTYQNTNSYTLNVLVGGSIGGVTNLEFSRDGITWYGTGSFYGQFTLCPLDYLRITYTVAPTVTGIPQ